MIESKQIILLSSLLILGYYTYEHQATIKKLIHNREITNENIIIVILVIVIILLFVYNLLKNKNMFEYFDIELDKINDNLFKILTQNTWNQKQTFNNGIEVNSTDFVFGSKSRGDCKGCRAMVHGALNDLVLNLANDFPNDVTVDSDLKVTKNNKLCIGNTCIDEDILKKFIRTDRMYAIKSGKQPQQYLSSRDNKYEAAWQQMGGAPGDWEAVSFVPR